MGVPGEAAQSDGQVQQAVVDAGDGFCGQSTAQRVDVAPGQADVRGVGVVTGPGFAQLGAFGGGDGYDGAGGFAELVEVLVPDGVRVAVGVAGG